MASEFIFFSSPVDIPVETVAGIYDLAPYVPAEATSVIIEGSMNIYSSDFWSIISLSQQAQGLTEQYYRNISHSFTIVELQDGYKVYRDTSTRTQQRFRIHGYGTETAFVGLDLPEITLSTNYNSWEVADLTPYGVPSNALGVCLHVYKDSNAASIWGVRPVGCTYSRVYDKGSSAGVPSVISLKVVNGQIEMYHESNINYPYNILGYFTSDVDFYVDPVITDITGETPNVLFDLPALPAGAKGGIVDIGWTIDGETTAASVPNYEIIEKGATVSGDYYRKGFTIGKLVTFAKCDGSGLIEARFGDPTTTPFELLTWGHFGAGAPPATAKPNPLLFGQDF